MITVSLSGFKHSESQAGIYPAALICPVTQHFLLSLLTLASLFVSFPFRMHLYTLTPVSSNSFFLPKMALNYAVMTGGMEVDGLSVSCSVHTDSDFFRWRTAGRYWAFQRLDVPMMVVSCTAANSFLKSDHKLGVLLVKNHA